MSLPSTSRPRDKLYTLFFLSYIPTILLFDSLPLYPPHLIPAPLSALHAWYLSTFNDRLILQQPPWFRFFALVELYYQLPLALYAVWALRSRSPYAPAHLLVWATVCAGTTATCLWEFYHHREMTRAQKGALIGMYGGYGVIFCVLAVDMFSRIQTTLGAAAKMVEKRKGT